MNRAFGIINFAGNHIKVDGLPYEILEKALDQARRGRLHIMNIIKETLPEPRPDLKPHAPRMVTLTVDKYQKKTSLPYRAPRNRPPLQHQLKTRQSEYHVYRTRSDRRHLQYRHYRLYGKHRVPRGDAS